MQGATSWSCLLGLYVGLLLAAADTQESNCPKPALTQDTVVTPLRSNVTLTCPGCEGKVSWHLHGQFPTHNRTRRPVRGGLLQSVKYRDEGNYTCIKDERNICTVQIRVTEELEKPVIQCYQRYPASNINCVWKPQRRLPPGTQTTLIVRKGLKSRPMTSPCSYNSSNQKFICRLKHKEGDSETYVLNLCVTSHTDSRTSDQIMSKANSLLWPDKPVDVTVSPVEGAPRKLKVSWRNPKSWNPVYYTLHFQVQYRVENSRYTSNATTTGLTYLIEDALKGKKHLVQVRAQEEYEHGTWSSWSRVAEGTPWTDPQQYREALSTLDPRDYDHTFYWEYDTTESGDGSTRNGGSAA
ncbi:interleukin-6 receptor subunit alpha [Rhinophrynus dorsalis]